VLILEINNNSNIILPKAHLLVNNDEQKDDANSGQTNPQFKGRFDNFLNKSGDFMNMIEKGGFLVLFLIQDFLGMTIPRTYAGFLRDKEVTGEYNIQEGFEVFGREILTGPSMMAVAPLSLWLASKSIGQSTSVNTELIKRYGNALREVVTEPDFNKNILKDSKEFKNLFYKKNIANILKQTIGEKAVTKESIDYIMTQLKNYEEIPKDAVLKRIRGKARYRNECLDNITAYINNIKYNASDDLDMLQKVKLGSEKLNDVKTFDTKKAFDGLIKYSNDTITANKKLEKLDSVMAESLKHKALGKRVLINFAMLGATLGVLSVLPKIYAKSDTAPGARKKQASQENTNNGNVSFKGKNSNNLLEKIGKAIEKIKKDFVSNELEYNGHNFTHTLMAGLSVFGLLIPRGLRAYNRAQTDTDGKKDLTEIWEIIIRDLTSSLAVVFAVPMLTRAFVTSYEKNSGFVLMQKDRNKTGFKQYIDLINPYSKAHVLSNAEVAALYENINTKEKMVNFFKYIDKNGGDLQKILSKLDNKSELFNKNTIQLEELAKLSKEKSNKQLIKFAENIEDYIKKLGNDADKKAVNNIITKCMKNTAKGGNNKMTAIARGLISVPGLLTTFFISPYLLGWFIPRLTYSNTRRIHAKQDREQELKEQKKINTAA